PHAGDGHPLAVDVDVAVADELAGGKHRGNKLCPIDQGIEPAFQKPDHVGAGIALEPPCLRVDAAELPLGDVAVIAAQFLLGAQLYAIVREFSLAALTVLARAVFAPVDGAFGAAPDILAHAAVDLVLR